MRDAPLASAAVPARVLALLLLILACGACGGGDDDGEEEAVGNEATAGETGCREVEAPAPKEEGGQTAPDGPLDARERPELVVRTNCGEFTIRLDPASAPNTTASFVKLAENGYFDDTIFHRIVPNFVIQGGDPTGTGMGGPGYSTVDKPKPDAKYTKGVVAMAKTAQEPAGTSGSQFFVVTGDDIGLPPDYAVIGEVTDGLDVVERIGRLGDPATEQPRQTVVIERMTVNR